MKRTFRALGCVMAAAVAVPVMAQAEGFSSHAGCGNAFRTCAAVEVSNESRGLSFRIAGLGDRVGFNDGRTEVRIPIRDEVPVSQLSSTSGGDLEPCPSKGGTLHHPGDCPATVTPEPATMTLLATGLLGISGMGITRRKKKQIEDLS